VLLGEARLLLIVGLLLSVGHGFPARTQNLGDVRVVHVRTLFQNLAPFVTGPKLFGMVRGYFIFVVMLTNHECIHGPFEV